MATSSVNTQGRRFKQDQRVKILRGKNEGRYATVSYEATPHPLSRERRFYLHLQNRKDFWGSNHLLMNESGFVEVEEAPHGW